MAKKKATAGDSNGPGCISIVLGIVALWALIFGLSVDGKHYGLSKCSCERGVEVDTGR